MRPDGALAQRSRRKAVLEPGQDRHAAPSPGLSGIMVPTVTSPRGRPGAGAQRTHAVLAIR